MSRLHFPKGRISLRSLLCAVVLITIGLCVIGFSLFPLFKYQKLMQKQEESYCIRLVLQMRNSVMYSLNGFDNKLNGFIRDPLIYDEICRDGASGESAEELFSKAFKNHFSPLSADYYYFESLELYVKNSEEHFMRGRYDMQISYPFSSNYYEKALERPLEYRWMGYNDAVNAIEVSKIIYDFETYEVLGLLIIRLSPSFFLDVFNSFTSLSSDNIFIIDEDENILASLDFRYTGSASDRDFASQFLEPSGVFYTDHTANIYSQLTDSKSASPYCGWKIVIESEDSLLRRNLSQTLGTVTLIALLLALAGILAALYFSNSITTLVNDLTDSFKRVQKNDYSTKVTNKTCIREIDTVTDVVDGYNKTVQNLSSLINTVYKEQLNLNEMRFKALQTRINPHFLFNTLQLITWKAQKYNATDVFNMIQALSYMLESDLNDKNEKYILLEDELEYINNYIFIIKCRFMDKISIDIMIPEELLSCYIPKLLLQPILENAIVHGVSQKIDAGHVLLTAQQIGDHITFIIEDDGNGMRPDVLRNLKKSIQTDSNNNLNSPDVKDHHIALTNIYRRLQILYGDDFTFDIESQNYIGTRVTLRIPMMTEIASDYSQNEVGSNAIETNHQGEIV